MSVIKAGTTLTTAYTVEADTNGDLVFQTNGSTTALTLTSAQAATFELGLVVNEGGADSDTRIEGDTDTNLFFVDASTDRIGIGTSGPQAKFHIRPANSDTPASALWLEQYNAAGTDRAVLAAQVDATNNLVVFNSSGTNAGGYEFQCGNIDRLKLTSDGNLGLGVTPSAWGSGAKSLEGVGGALTFFDSTNDQLWLTQNAYWDGAWKYKTTNYATSFQQYLGSHVWFTAPSGTAGNTITFTQAMTLDASGNLLVGLTSGGKFSVSYGGNDTHFGLGANYDNYITAGSSGVTIFRNATTERARITDGGVLCVGTAATNSADKLSVYSTTIGNANVGLVTIRSGKTADTSDCVLSLIKFSNDTTTSQIFVKFGSDNYNSGQGQINANGSGQAAFGSFSDRRLKENIVDLESQWQNVKALRPVEFDYIASEGGGHQLGFIAQEVKEVYPDLVGERQDGMLTLSGMGKGEARLIKALQEAMTRIEQLESEVAALKGAG